MNNCLNELILIYTYCNTNICVPENVFFLLVDSLKNTFQPFFSSILQTDFFEKRRLNIKTNYSFFFLSEAPDKNFYWYFSYEFLRTAMGKNEFSLLSVQFFP